MTKVYKVYQVSLTEEQLSEIARVGWGKTKFGYHYLDITGMTPAAEDSIKKSYDMFSHAMTIKCSNINEAFVIGNFMGEPPFWKSEKAFSISIGNIVIDENGVGKICDKDGWKDMSTEFVREFETNVTQQLHMS